MNRIPWAVLLALLVGIGLGLASVSIESWSIAVTYLGIALGSVPAAFGIDRWLEHNHPRHPRQRSS